MDEARRLAQVDFDDLAVEYLTRPGVDRAPMFGGSGLRLNGKFFAFVGSGGRLVLKVPQDRAGGLVAAGSADAVKVGGRPTREWIGVPHEHLASWAPLIAEAYDYLAAAVAPSPE